MNAFSQIGGYWNCNDGAVYFITEDPDSGTVTWVGLDSFDSAGAPVFFRGTQVANVFQGHWEDDGVTVRGEWVDVPRGQGAGYGRLTFMASWRNEYPGDQMRLLTRVDNQTSGGFAGSVWTSDGLWLTEPDIAQTAMLVRRPDSSLSDNNPPCRDFTVMWGEVIDVDWPAWPSDRENYRAFFDTSVNDHDFSFSIWPAWRGDEFPYGTDQTDFWLSGWVWSQSNYFPEPPAVKVWEQYNKHPAIGGRFHCEAMMYGRNTDESHADDPFQVLVPGWNEQGGNSVLINGFPIDGNILGGRNYPGSPTLSTMIFNDRPDYGAVPIDLAAGEFIRVTGVVAMDIGHHHWYDGSVIDASPEIHPVYAVDFPQKFDDPNHPRKFPLYSGTWHGSDNGTYYLRQIGETVWWLGLSRDQGWSYANVFKGTVMEGGIVGTWTGIAMNANLTPTFGELVIDGGGNGEASTLLTTYAVTPRRGAAGFPASWWTKLYDARPIVPPHHVGPTGTGPSEGATEE